MRIWSCCSPVISLAVYKRCRWIKTPYLSMTGSRGEGKEPPACARVPKSLKSTVYLCECAANHEPEGNSDDKTAHMDFFLSCDERATFPMRDFPFCTSHLLPDKPPYHRLSEERLFDDAALRTSERAESPLLRLLMRGSLTFNPARRRPCAGVCWRAL